MINITKGKNFSTNNASGNRKLSDFYETPFSITQQFLYEWSIDRSSDILEPSCGNGAIVKVLKENSFTNITYQDLLTGNDFLSETNHFTYLITNPPFSKAYEFIIKAKEIVTNQFAMLLPLSYLHGKKRYDNVWSDKEFKLKDIFVFTRYPMLGEALRMDGKYHTGMMVYAWYVWNKEYIGNPEIKWIDNNSYVIGKND